MGLSLPMHQLITPLEPARPASSFAASPVAGARQVRYATATGRLDVAAATACGRHHDRNEDTHSPLDGRGRVFVVADGVGGGAMAQLASQLLVERLHQALERRPPAVDDVAAAMLDADRAIAEAIARRTARPGAATVALCAALDADASRWMVAWVGDCRVYRWSPRAATRLDALTRDDTFRHLGEPAPAGGSPDDPARMVGNGATTGANCAIEALAEHELLAVCSDGVHKHLSDADWCRLLARRLPLADRCASLVAQSRTNGSTDDATVLLIERQPAEPGGAAARPDAGVAAEPFHSDSHRRSAP